jgi:hypothetical protein
MIFLAILLQEKQFIGGIFFFAGLKSMISRVKVGPEVPHCHLGETLGVWSALEVTN